MANNTDEEPLADHTGRQPEKPGGENMPAGETGIIDHETENMEVHHHPDLHHKPKKGKEYFLEFLMIFLAVTMGFIAENLREHITNRSKEKEYIRAFIRNVQDDTAN